jgi:hypothetical protein
VHTGQASGETGSVLVLAFGLLMALAALGWARYVTQVQRLAARMMRHEPREAILRFTRWFGIFFLSITALAAFLSGLVGVLSH